MAVLVWPLALFSILSERPFPGRSPCRLLSLQVPDFLHLFPSFILHNCPEAEAWGWPAPRHAGPGQPSPGCPEAVPVRGGEDRGAGRPRVPPLALLQQQNGKFWIQKRDNEVPTSEDRKDWGAVCQRPADVCGRYVTCGSTRWILKPAVFHQTHFNFSQEVCPLSVFNIFKMFCSQIAEEWWTSAAQRLTIVFYGCAVGCYGD